jgi:dihydroorotate dehydrogenase electron transfer subunit
MPEFVYGKKGIFLCPVLTNGEVARGIFLMRLYAPEIAATVRPGQFVNVQVASGEWLGGGCFPLLRRPFSVCEANRHAGTISLIWKIVGAGTNLLARHQPGAVLNLVGPLGHGFELSGTAGPIALVAGGVGVAPLPILAMELASRRLSFDALLGARNAEELWGARELSALGGNVQIATDDGSRGGKGFVTKLLAQWLRDHKNSQARVFACGPMPMLHAVAELCLEARVEAQIAIETMMGCGFGICMGCPVTPAAGAEEFGRYYLACLDGPVFGAETIRFNA